MSKQTWSNRVRTHGWVLELGILFALALTGCATTVPTDSPSPQPGPKASQSTQLVGVLHLDGQRIPVRLSLGKPGERFPVRLTSDIGMSGAGEALLNGDTLTLTIHYRTICDGVTRLEGTLHPGGRHYSGELSVTDCTGVVLGRFDFSGPAGALTPFLSTI